MNRRFRIGTLSRKNFLCAMGFSAAGLLASGCTPEQIVARARGKVWECHIGASRVEPMTERMAVANVRYAADGHAVVRVVADAAPVPDARLVRSTI